MMEMDGFIPLLPFNLYWEGIAGSHALKLHPRWKEERNCLIILTWPLYCGQAERTEVYLSKHFIFWHGWVEGIAVREVEKGVIR